MIVPNPPSVVTGAVREWMASIANALNAMPNFSYFTQNTPEGNVLGVNGDVAIYNGSSSTLSHWWINQSDKSSVPSTHSWALVVTL